MNRVGDRSKWALTFGFAAIVIMMSVVIVVGLANMAQTDEQIRLIVDQYNVRRVLLEQMRVSARERVVSLQQMLLLSDPFARDEHGLRIDRLGVAFAEARQQLLSMGLSEREQMLLVKQSRLTRLAVPAHREAVRLIAIDRFDEARNLLIERVIPLQRQVLGTIGELQLLEEQAAREAFLETVHSHQKARLLMHLLGGGAVAVCIFIALVTVRRSSRTEHNLFREKEQALVTLHAIGDGVISATAAGRIEYMNPVAEQLTGYRDEKVRGRNLLSVLKLVDEKNLEPLARSPQELVQQEHDCTTPPALLIDARGQPVAVEHATSPIRDRNGVLIGLVVVFRDATESRALARRLSYQAHYDPLTNLLNRQEFRNRLARALKETREDGSSHVVCFLDLDRFKVVNDTCGHAAGDELLKQLVARLKPRIRNHDVFARLGGDEFGLLLEGCPTDKAYAIVEEIRHEVNEYRFAWDGRSFTVGLSVGMVTVDSKSGELESILAAADAACYAAKDEGRNRIHVYSDATRTSQAGRIPWQVRLRRALDDDHFALYCQSIEALDREEAKQGPIMCELHLRFRDEQGQPMPPLAFIPAAERYQMMPEIDRWVLDQAIKLACTLDDPRVIYSMNVSNQTLANGDFADYVRTRFEGETLDPRQLCFEIAENGAVADLPQTRRLIDGLKEIGCQVALDDVGRSLASFDYLKQLPIDYIKIDGHLIRDITDDAINSIQVQAISSIGRLLGIRIIAEQVEDRAALKLLAELGIDLAQGFAIAKPRPVSELLASCPVELASAGNA